jgi:surface antigen
MFDIEGRCALLCLCLVCAAPVAAQTMPDGAPSVAAPCQNIVGQAEIDGTLQQVTGLACQQPDGSWQFVQGDDGAVAFYAPQAYPYYDPWYWGGFVTVVGGSFVFIDRFHHHYPMNHVHFSHASYGARGPGNDWHGTGGMHGGWGGMPHGGGGMHR